MNEIDVAKKIAEGDPWAIDRFVRDQYPALFRLLRHLTRSREDAEDLAQLTLIAARQKIGSYRGESSLKTWLHRIAFNVYSQWKRKRKKEGKLPSEASFHESGFDSVVEGEALLSALATLSDKHREAFVLHEIEELPIPEVAKIVRAPIGTVKARLFYARRGLRAYMSEGQKETNHESRKAIV